MSKASDSHTLNLSRRHLTVGAAMRDELRRVRHQLRRDAMRHGKRAWLAAAASGLCLMLAAPIRCAFGYPHSLAASRTRLPANRT